MKRFILFLFLIGCAKATPPPQAPERLPITEQAEEVSDIPAYQPPTPGDAVGLAEGDPAPFDGVLLDETKAGAAAKLRISYDEVYQLALSNKKALLTIIQIQERELMSADKTIDQKEKALREIRDSWWAKHKLTVGVVTGVVLGIAGTVAAGRVWAAIDDD
jgi:hypothetical protein